MSKQDVSTFARKYWPFSLLAVPLLLGLLARTVAGGADVADETRVLTPPKAHTVQSLEIAKDRFVATPQPRRMTPQEKTKAILQQYEEELQQDSASENTEAILIAAGNLYRQKLRDYKKAAHYYQRYIDEFPNGPNISLAYVQLSTCFQRLNDGMGANRLHLQMQKVFPKDSQEYQYAQQMLRVH